MESYFLSPDEALWNTRRQFIDIEIEKADTQQCYLVSDHATALFMDMQVAYCAGAWLSVIITSISVIDAHLRDTQADDTTIGTAKLLNKYYTSTEINWLRILRNKYVHMNVEAPMFQMNDWFNNQKIYERDASTAITMTIRALFQ